MLSQINRELGRDYTMMAISIMIGDLNSFFNVKGSMNNKQIAMTAKLILDNKGFYDLSLNNIKACFEYQMMNARLFDRLDGNIIIQWLREFKSEMADSCENQYIEQSKQTQSDNSISYEVYLASLKAKADSGDTKSQEILAEMDRRNLIPSQEEQRKKEIDFRLYKHRYYNNKNNEGK